MRTFTGVILGLLLFFPGILLLQWLSVSVLGLYDAMTLTDGCLVMIIVLLCVNLARMPTRESVRSRSRQRTHVYQGEPQPTLTSDRARGSSSRRR